MQFRTSSGGMEVGCVTYGDDGTSLQVSGYWPFGALGDQDAAFHDGPGSLDAVMADPSGYFLVVPGDGGDAPSYVFATPSGISAVDNQNGNMIVFEQPDAPDHSC